MKAICHARYGSPDVLELKDIDKPVIDDDGVLVRVHAAAANPLDWRSMRGLPYIVRMMGLGLRKPRWTGRGVDVAGQVEAVGENVTRFQPADEVFGGCGGAFAEYVRGGVQDFVPKPERLTYEQAAAIPLAGCTALQALRDAAQVQPGQKVLINGAAGGVGTYAVQIAKAFGANVTGVCSTNNVDMVRSIGANQVVDYTAADFAGTGERYDVIVDAVGNRSLSDLRRALAPKGTLVVLGGGRGRLLGPLAQMVRARALSPFVGPRLVPLVAKQTQADLMVLCELIEAGKVTPVIDRTFALSRAAEAMRYLEAGHARGKVIVTVSSS